MLKILATLARVGLGFVLASLTAGLVTVLFVNTPSEIAAQPVSQYSQTATDTLDLALLTATHSAIFAAAFVLIAAGFGEWFSIRALPFYLILGCAISLLGLAAQFSSEIAGQPTILNNYAIQAFLTAGFFAGFIYWLAAGQFAGSPAPEETVAEVAEITAAPEADSAVTKPADKRRRRTELPTSEEDENSSDTVIIERPKTDPLAWPKAQGARLLERLASTRNRLATQLSEPVAGAEVVDEKTSETESPKVRRSGKDA